MATGRVWYVAYSKPRLERSAEENLLRQNYQVRLPLVRKIVRRQVSLEPLFPRYLFFQPSSDQQSLSPARSTVGVSSIVRFGMELATLSHERCDRIMEFAQAQQEGGLEALLGIQGIATGQKVFVNAGPFAGLEGLVSSVAKDRVVVLMTLLGKPQSLGFTAADLSAI
jgi:transcriptional antiterminator RfaH